MTVLTEVRVLDGWYTVCWENEGEWLAIGPFNTAEDAESEWRDEVRALRCGNRHFWKRGCREDVAVATGAALGFYDFDLGRMDFTASYLHFRGRAAERSMEQRRLAAAGASTSGQSDHADTCPSCGEGK